MVMDKPHVLTKRVGLQFRRHPVKHIVEDVVQTEAVKWLTEVLNILEGTYKMNKHQIEIIAGVLNMLGSKHASDLSDD